MNSPNPGRILFVGAGPGNPDLLTVRARELLTSTATAWVDEDVLSAVTALVGIDLPVPADKLKEHKMQFQQMDYGMKPGLMSSRLVQRIRNWRKFRKSGERKQKPIIREEI